MRTMKPLPFLLLVLLMPVAVQAQFNYSDNGNGTCTITGYTGSGGAVNIPSTINGLTNISIGDNAFYQCYSLTGVTIPNTVTSLGVQAFSACTSLTSVTIPNSVTNIGAGAFAFCDNLTNATIPSSVTYIDFAAFYFCTSLIEVHLQGNAPELYTSPSGEYDPDVFYGDGNATAFYLPGTTGWDSSFGGLPTWSSYYTTNNGTITIVGYAGVGGAVTIPTTFYGLPVTSIGTNAFAYDSSLTSITIPSSVTNIGDETFYLCTNLTMVYFQGNAPGIGSNVFYSVTNATVYYLPETTGWGATFAGLTSWTLYPYNYTTTNGTITITFYTGTGGAVTIPSKLVGLPVIGISDYAFEDCRTLTSVTIPNSVTSIGIDAFAYCTSLISVTIPSSVTSLASVAFQNSTSLKEVYFQGNALNVPYSDAFAQDTNLVVYYLSGTLGWNSTYEGHPTALWLPKIQSGDGNFGVQTNQFGFNIKWASGQVVVVEASTNLTNPVWIPVATNTLTSGSSYFCDSQWMNYPGRYYRLRSP